MSGGIRVFAWIVYDVAVFDYCRRLGNMSCNASADKTEKIWLFASWGAHIHINELKDVCMEKEKAEKTQSARQQNAICLDAIAPRLQQ